MCCVLVEDLDIPRDQNIDVRDKLKLEAYKKAGINMPGWTVDEERLQMFMDNIRGQDFHYRFTRTLKILTKYFHKDGETYLIATEEIDGVSPIGNRKHWVWNQGITYIPQAVYTSVPTSSESYKTETVDISGGDPLYKIPFTKAAVEEELKAAPKYPKNNLFGVALKIRLYSTDITYRIKEKDYELWLSRPVEDLYEACKTGKINIAMSQKEVEDADSRISALSDEQLLKELERRKDNNKLNKK